MQVSKELKELEKEIVVYMRKAMEDDIITLEESKRIKALLNKLNTLILENGIITLDDINLVRRIYIDTNSILKQNINLPAFRFADRL